MSGPRNMITIHILSMVTSLDTETKKEVLRKLILEFVQELYFGDKEFDVKIENQVHILNNFFEKPSRFVDEP